jgi:hypothetical protein
VGNASECKRESLSGVEVPNFDDEVLAHDEHVVLGDVLHGKD